MCGRSPGKAKTRLLCSVSLTDASKKMGVAVVGINESVCVVVVWHKQHEQKLFGALIAGKFQAEGAWA